MKFSLISLTVLVQLTLAQVHELPHWGYGDDANGPKNWGKLHKDFEACDGNRQSPIDLSRSSKLVTNKINSRWVDIHGKLSLEHNGHALEVKTNQFKGTNTLLNCTKFELQNFHLHAPSEHTIDGKRYDLELHFVFSNLELKQNKVFGILFEKSAKTTEDFFKHLPIRRVCNKKHDKATSSDNHCTSCTNKFDFKGFEFSPLTKDLANSKVWNYLGSLTTPPCSQNVHWTVSSTILPIHPDHLELIHHSIGSLNSRPIQKITHSHNVGVETITNC